MHSHFDFNIQPHLLMNIFVNILFPQNQKTVNLVSVFQSSVSTYQPNAKLTDKK